MLLIFFLHEASCHDDQIKLIEGITKQNGHLEICFDQRWETLDYYRWSPSAAKVACIELGFSSNKV